MTMLQREMRFKLAKTKYDMEVKRREAGLVIKVAILQISFFQNVRTSYCEI